MKQLFPGGFLLRQRIGLRGGFFVRQRINVPGGIDMTQQGEVREGSAKRPDTRYDVFPFRIFGRDGDYADDRVVPAFSHRSVPAVCKPNQGRSGAGLASQPSRQIVRLFQYDSGPPVITGGLSECCYGRLAPAGTGRAPAGSR